MRSVIWTDRHGYKHRSLIRDDDPDDAAEQGILQDPPDLHLADWEGVIRDLHNLFVEHGIYSWEELQKANNLHNLVFRPVKKRIIGLFRSME